MTVLVSCMSLNEGVMLVKLTMRLALSSTLFGKREKLEFRRCTVVFFCSARKIEARIFLLTFCELIMFIILLTISWQCYLRTLASVNISATQLIFDIT